MSNGDKKKKRVEYANYKGKRYMYTSTDGKNWEGRPVTKPDYKPKKVKAKTNYKSTRSKKGRPKK